MTLETPDLTPVISGDELKATAVQAVRFKLKHDGAFGRCSDLTDDQIYRVIVHANSSVTIAVDALAMRPWPTWLMDVLYPGRTSKP